ncbi:Uncharacterized protein TCM_032214, partial [Theobroma cacao]
MNSASSCNLLAIKSMQCGVNLQCLHMKQNVSLVAAPGNIHRCNMSPPKERLMSLTVKVFFSNTMNSW